MKGKSMETTIEVRVTGATPAEVFENLTKAASAWGTVGSSSAPTVKTRKTKAAAPIIEEELDLEAADDLDDLADEPANAAYDEMSFDEEETAPAAKKTKKAAAPKVTEKDVNQAAMAHAKRHGDRKKTLAILTKKFGVKSVSELEPGQYAEVVAALKA